MQDYPSKKGPRSPYVEDVKDEEDRDVGHQTGQGLTTPAVETEAKAEEEGEYPLEMPCGHVFGSTCLKEWLYQSPTCPLCRVEVESYTEEPPTFAFPWIRHPEQTEANRPSTSSTANDATPSDEMHADPAPTTDAPPTTAESTPSPAADPPDSQIPVPFPIAFQFIFSSPPTTTPTTSPTTTVPQSTATPPPTSTPNVSRPPSSHTVRHHPYARTPTPSPLNTQISTPIVPDLAPSVSNRPDLFCAQRGSGLCDHDITDESLIRLECGHAFHPDCLEGSMLVEGYPITPDERRCPRCRRWMGVLQ